MPHTPHETDVIILGAGASGLYCALHAARAGLSVIVIDHGPKPAAKVRISGGGRCNFTNLDANPTDYVSENPHFCKSALARHTPWDVVSFFAECGLTYEEKAAGQLFCEQKAGRLAGELVDRARKSGVQIITNATIDRVSGKGPFRLKSGKTTLTARHLVVALGGPSWPQAGATDLGFRMARQYGLKIIPPRPALVGLVMNGRERNLCRSLAGVALPVRVTCDSHSEQGDLLFTHKGLSGPVPMQLSLHREDNSPLEVNFLPNHDMAALVDEHRSGKLTLGGLLSRYMPKRCSALLPGHLAETPLTELTKKELEQADQSIHHHRFTSWGTEGYAKAEVTAGGVDTADISSKTMESRSVPGLFFIGEVLDVTGRLGGYNLHWAWASAHACAHAIAAGSPQKHDCPPNQR